jgi:hypothetical protein
MRGGAGDRYAERRELLAQRLEKASDIVRESALLAQPAQERGLSVAVRRR